MTYTAVALLLLFVMPVAAAQTPAFQESIEVAVGIDGNATVVHTVRDSSEPGWLQLVQGNTTDMVVRNAEGGNIEYDLLPGHALLIEPSESDVTIQYVVNGAMAQEGNMWVWDFLYLDTLFTFPEEIDTIYANQRPVYHGGEGIRCHGCQMRLEFTLDEPVWLSDVVWGDHTFVVAVRSHDAVGPVTLHQPSMSIDFDIERGGEMVTVVVPRQMLGEPYRAYLDGEAILYHEYRNNGTHVWVHMRPPDPGTITLVGSSVILEFPVTTIVLMAACMPLLGTLAYRRIYTSRSPARQSGARAWDALWHG